MNQNNKEDFRWLPFDSSDLTYLIRKHILILLAAPIALASLGVFSALRTPPKYTAGSSFLIKSNFDNDLHIRQAGESSSGREDLDSLQSLASSLVTETSILKMVDNLNLREAHEFLGKPSLISKLLRVEKATSDSELLKEIKHRYHASLRPGTRLIDLRVEDYSSKRSVSICNELSKVFLENLKKQRLNQTHEIRAALVSQAGATLKTALNAEEKLKAFRISHRDVPVEQDSKLFEERILQQSTALNQSKAETARLLGIVNALEGVDPTTNAYLIFQTVNQTNDQYLSDLLRQESAARSELALTEQSYTQSHPRLRDAIIKMQDAQNNVTRYAEELRLGATAAYLSEKRRMDHITQGMASLQKTFVEYKSNSAEFRGIREDIDRSWNTHSQLQERIMNLDLSPKTPPSFMTLVSGPLAKKSTTRALPVLAGGMLGIMTALAIVFWRNRKGLPFTSSTQTSRVLGLQQIGDIQYVKKVDPVNAFANLEESPKLRDIITATGGQRIIHITGLRKTLSVGLLAKSFGRRMGRGGLKTLLVKVVEGDNDDSINYTATEPFYGAGNFSTVLLPAILLLDPVSFGKRISNLFSIFDRVIIDSSELDANESKVAIARMSEITILSIDGEGKKARGDYKNFVQTMQTRGVQSAATVYLKESSFMKTTHKEEPKFYTSSVKDFFNSLSPIQAKAC